MAQRKLQSYLKTKIIIIYKIPCYPSLRVYASPGPPVTSFAPDNELSDQRHTHREMVSYAQYII